MNNKPNVPDELITLNLKRYSFWTDIKVNGWLFVAMLTACANIMLLHSNTFRIFHLHEKDWPVLAEWLHPHAENWPVVLRAIIELLPMFLSLLWVRDVVRWIRGMDELHRRIMLEAGLFAVIGTLFFVTVWDRLQKMGILKAIFQPPAPPLERWDYRQLAHLDFSYFPLIAALLCFFFFLGHTIFNRRYK
jgi:hypothetical protein